MLDGTTVEEQSLVALLDVYFTHGTKLTANLAAKFCKKVKLLLHPDKNKTPRSQEAFKAFDTIWQDQLQGPIATKGFSQLRPSPASKLLCVMCQTQTTLKELIATVRSDIKKGETIANTHAPCVVCLHARLPNELFICSVCRETFNASSQRRAYSAPPNRGSAHDQPPPNRGSAHDQPPPNRGSAQDQLPPNRGSASGDNQENNARELFPGEFNMWKKCGPTSTRTKVPDEVYESGNAKLEIRVEPFNMDFMIKFSTYCASRLARSSWSGLLAETMSYAIQSSEFATTRL